MIQCAKCDGWVAELGELEPSNPCVCTENKIKALERQLAKAREAICIYVREFMDTSGLDNDEDAVLYFKNTFNEENYN